MHFRLYPLRFSFLARDSIHFPPGKSSNLLRGGFGLIFRRTVCAASCSDAHHCEVRSTCPYARMFEPSATGSGPSGFADWPRPFVFRAAHLDGRTIQPGEPFFFDFHLFDMRSPAIPQLERTFAELAREGFGPGRGRADLLSASCPDGTSPAPLELSLLPAAHEVTRVRVRFVTPTELKSGPQPMHAPEFGVLAARIRDRVSKLRELYDDGPLAIDFRGFGQRAREVRMTRCEISRIHATRRSSRTGQVHPIGGFVGEADYEGGLTEFVPYLNAAKWTGVGRQTVWGKGEIDVLPPLR